MTKSSLGRDATYGKLALPNNAMKLTATYLSHCTVPHFVRARATPRGFLASLRRRAIGGGAAAYRGAVGQTQNRNEPENCQ